jgi:hypothetical protein
MKNQNIVLIAIVFALAVALAPVTKAAPAPSRWPPPPTGPEDVQLPMVTIHSAGNILRGKTGSFVLDMKPALMFGATYVNFSISGTAIAGVDYVQPISPAFLGQSGYGVISFATLPDPRAGSSHQAYSVVVTLEPGLGYALGGVTSRSAVIWIKSSL